MASFSVMAEKTRCQIDNNRADGFNKVMTEEPIKGPASYFPSIEKKYGRAISEWKDIVRKRYPAKHMELVAMLKT